MSDLNFPIGTFFQARAVAVLRMAELDLEWDDYSLEFVPGDGSVLHAFERLLPLVVRAAGYEITVTHVPGITR